MLVLVMFLMIVTRHSMTIIAFLTGRLVVNAFACHAGPISCLHTTPCRWDGALEVATNQSQPIPVDILEVAYLMLSQEIFNKQRSFWSCSNLCFPQNRAGPF